MRVGGVWRHRVEVLLRSLPLGAPPCLATACWQVRYHTVASGSTVGPCAPPVESVVALTYAGRPAARSSQPLSHGHRASMRSMAWRAVSTSNWLAAGAAATCAVLRARRCRARVRPPRRPMLRHWSMVRLNKILPRSRFMAPRFIDRVGWNIKRIMRARSAAVSSRDHYHTR